MATLYYSDVMANWMVPWTPYPNYLFALAEWLLKQSGEPPEVVAGKVESDYGWSVDGCRDPRFEKEFLRILYSPWDQGGIVQTPSSGALRAGQVPRSPFDEIMLTEAHYHAAASDLYSWSNLCLVRCFSSSVGVIAGMSMTDRNLRRLLHALKHTKQLDDVYIILKEPQTPVINSCDALAIHENAKRYASRFSRSGGAGPRR